MNSKAAAFLLCLFVCLPLWGQDYLHGQYYGQGDTREEALSALLHAVAKAVPFVPESLCESYRSGISAAAVEESRHGKRVLSLSGSALDALFQARQTRTADILEQARKNTDPGRKRLYYRWAWYYLASLPAGHELPGKAEALRYLQTHQDIPEGRLPVPMTHIEREVAQLRNILGEIPLQAVQASTPAPKPDRQQKAPARQQQATEMPVSIRPHWEKLSSAWPLPSVGVTAPLSTAAPSPHRPYVTERPVPETRPLSASLLFTAGFAPENLLGATLSLRRKNGLVLAFKSNFQHQEADYTALSSGERKNGTYLWPNGHSRVRQFRFCAGLSRRLFPWADVYVSGGYGQRWIYWQDRDESWGRIRDLSSQGVVLAGGLLFSYKHGCALIESETLAFSTLGVSVGIGLNF